MDEKVNSILKKIEKFGEEIYIAAVPRTTAKLLRFLVLATNAKNVLELGSSVGYSTIWFASALKEFKGHIYTTEISEDRAKLAKLNFQDAGLEDTITLFEEDSVKVLSDWKYGELDIIFIDAMKRDYLKYYVLALPLLKKGSLIIADDVNKLKEKMKDFLEYVKKDKSVHSTILDIDDGIMLVHKK